MDITFTGVIVEVSPVQQGNSKRDGKPWAKQEFVIEEVNQRYPSRCVFQVFGQERLQKFSIGQGEMITAHLGINANKSQEGRWFNKLDCWKVDRFGQQQQNANPTYVAQQDTAPVYAPQQSVFDQNNMNGGFGQSASNPNVNGGFANPPFQNM